MHHVEGKIIEDLLAHERFAAALELVNKLPFSWRNEWWRGIALSGMSRQIDAMPALGNALASMPAAHKLRCTLDLTLAYCRQGDWQKATQTLSATTDTEPCGQSDDETEQIGYLSGLILMRQGTYNKAISQLQLTLSNAISKNLHKIQVDCAATLLCIYRLTGQFSKFHSLFGDTWPLAQSLALSFRLTTLAYEAATVAEESGQPEQASHFIRLAEQYLQDCGTEVMRGDIFTFHANRALAQGRLHDGEMCLHRADESYQRSDYPAGRAICAYNLALIYQQKGNYAHALKQAQGSEAFAVQANYQHGLRLAWLLSGYLYRHLGNSIYAQKYLAQALHGFEDVSDWALAIMAAAELCQVADSQSIPQLKATVMTLSEKCDKSILRATALRSYAQLLMAERDWDKAIEQLRAIQGIAIAANAVLEQARCDLLLAECILKSKASDNFSIQSVSLLLAKTEKNTSGLPEFDVKRWYLQAVLAQHKGHTKEALEHILCAAEAATKLKHYSIDPLLSGHISATIAHVFGTGISIAFDLKQWGQLLHLSRLRRHNWYARHTHHDQSTVDQGKLDELIAHSRAIRRFLDRDQPTDRTEYKKHINFLRELYQRFDQHAHSRSDELSVDNYDFASMQQLTSKMVATIQSELSRLYDNAWTAIMIEPLDHLGQWVLIKVTPYSFDAHIVSTTHMVRHWLRQATHTTNRYPQVIYGKSAQVYPQAKPCGDALAAISSWLGVDEWISLSSTTNHHLLIADCEPFTRLSFAALPTLSGVLGQRTMISHIINWGTGANTPRSLRKLIPTQNWRVLCIAPVTFIDADQALLATQDELHRVQTLWPTATILAGGDASLITIRSLHSLKLLVNFDLIYIASHIVFDHDLPRLTSIVLSDGELTAEEIAGWDISAQLVCVTGCQGARSYNHAGEERVGIEAAFIGAGADKVITNLWSIPDSNTAQKMEVFLENLFNLGRADTALAAMAHSAREEPLYNWAGWRLTEAQ